MAARITIANGKTAAGTTATIAVITTTAGGGTTDDKSAPQQASLQLPGQAGVVARGAAGNRRDARLRHDGLRVGGEASQVGTE